MKRIKEFDISPNIVISLKEAKIDKESRTADIIALKAGWSKNKNHYSVPVVESLAPLLMQRRKIYVNHVEEKDKGLGRNEMEWAATVEEAYGKDGVTKAKIKFTDNPATSWIFEEALIHPEEVQFSIDALARAKEGEIEGKKGTIIEKFVFLDSLDIVSYASAGGQLIQAYASEMKETLDIIKEAADTLKSKVEKSVEKDKLRILMDTFINMLYGLSWTYEYKDAKEKKSKIKELVNEFLTEFNKVDVVKAFESNKNKGGDNVMNLAELKEKYPEFLKEYKKEVEKNATDKSKDEIVLSLTEDIDNLTEAKKTVETELEGTKTKLADSEKKEESTTSELNKYKFAETLAKKEKEVRKTVAESEFKDFDKLPEYIQKDLVNKEKEEDVKEALDAYLKLKETVSGIIEDAGVTTGTEKNKGKNTEVKEVAKNDEKAAELIKD